MTSDAREIRATAWESAVRQQRLVDRILTMVKDGGTLDAVQTADEVHRAAALLHHVADETRSARWRRRPTIPP